MTIEQLEQTLGAPFKDRALLKESLTHRSYLNEHPQWGFPHNERLEYLGDAVLELVVSEQLYALFPQFTEGELTAVRAALVNYQMLARVAQTLGIQDHLKMSRGEARDTGRAREVILANAIEAVIGALYLDQGLPAVSKLVERFLMTHVDEIIATKSYRDPKSLLQELAQERLKVTPTYKVLKEEGPAHQRIFTTGVYVGSKKIAEGKGPSKQEAEVEAARKALTLDL
jgi:ribonuclease-3